MTRPLWQRNGRDQPLIPNPDNPEELLTYRRVSTFANTLDTPGGLPTWTAAQAVKGAVLGGDEGVTIAKELAADVRQGQKKRVDRLVELGGGNQSRDTGTNRHEVLGSILSGQVRVDQVQGDKARAEIEHLLGLLDGLGPVVDLEVPVVNHRMRLAGSMDYLIDLPDGRRAVVDLKTGNTRKPTAWALQLGAYASALLWEDGTRVDKGRKPDLYVLWAPQSGKPKPRLVQIPVDYARRAMQLAMAVDALRKEGTEL